MNVEQVVIEITKLNELAPYIKKTSKNWTPIEIKSLSFLVEELINKIEFSLNLE